MIILLVDTNVYVKYTLHILFIQWSRRCPQELSLSLFIHPRDCELQDCCKTNPEEIGGVGECNPLIERVYCGKCPYQRT